MSEDELIKAAAKAAGEPVGDGDVDAAQLAELEHAVSVLRGATVEPDAGRRDDLDKEIGEETRIFKLYHFAAAAAVMFMIGLVVLFKVAMTPPAEPIRTAGDNRPAVNESREQSPPPEITDPGKPAGPEPEYTRPPWIESQVEKASQDPLGFGGGVGGGGTKPPGGLGGPPRGDGSGGSGDPVMGGPPETPLGKLRGLSTELKLELLHWAEPESDFKLSKVELIDAADSGAEFPIVRVRYQRADGRNLVIMQAAESEAARVAFDTTGLKGKVYTGARAQTRLLLISNHFTPEELATIAGDLDPA
jgi:hypothetical protein